MAGGALALRVAGRAKVGLSRRLHSMFTEEVAVVNDMAFGKGDLGLELYMATIAIARVPLALVCMTAEASWVLGPGVVVVGSDVDVAANAVAGAGFGVLRVRETHVFLGRCCSRPRPRTSVAVTALVGIVWVLVTFDAVGSRR